MQEFLTRLADVIEVDVVQPDDVLRNFEEWDSLTALAVVAMLDAYYGVNITATEFVGMTTAAELWQFVKSNKS